MFLERLRFLLLVCALLGGPAASARAQVSPDPVSTAPPAGDTTANYPIAHSGFITIEAGYQLGKQIVEIDGIDVDASSKLIHVGIGLGSYL